MKTYLKRIAYRNLSTYRYLRLLQKGYFTAYATGLLKFSSTYKYHYFVHRLIRKGDTVLDLGANLGYYSKLFARWVGPQGQVHSVEPIQIYNEVFRKATSRYKNITLYPYALGTEEKEITLISPSYDGYMHTGLPHVYNPQEEGKPSEKDLTFPAQMKIASRLFSSLGHVDYIKCDIEGYEVVVLTDLKTLIAAYRPIVQVEVSGDNLDSILSLFRSMQYLPYRLENKKLHLYAPAGRQDGEGDFLFIPEGDSRASGFMA